MGLSTLTSTVASMLLAIRRKPATVLTMKRKQKLSMQIQQGQSPVLKHLHKSVRLIKPEGDSWARDLQLRPLFSARRKLSAHSLCHNSGRLVSITSCKGSKLLPNAPGPQPLPTQHSDLLHQAAIIIQAHYATYPL